jgi:hypothetical protein
MRGRENISVCLNNLGPIFFRPLSAPESTDRPTKAEAFFPASRGVAGN